MRVIGVRVPEEVHRIWTGELTREKKRVISEVLAAMVRRHAEIKVEREVHGTASSSAAVYNVTVPSVVVNLYQAQEAKRYDPLCGEYAEALEARVRVLQEVLEARKAELRELRELLSRARSLAAAGDIEGLRRLLLRSG